MGAPNIYWFRSISYVLFFLWNELDRKSKKWLLEVLNRAVRKFKTKEEFRDSFVKATDGISGLVTSYKKSLPISAFWLRRSRITWFYQEFQISDQCSIFLPCTFLGSNQVIFFWPNLTKLEKVKRRGWKLKVYYWAIASRVVKLMCFATTESYHMFHDDLMEAPLN